MNGVKEEYSYKVKQNQKGIWYCEGLQIISERQENIASDMDRIMTEVEEVLAKHNNVETPTVQKAA